MKKDVQIKDSEKKKFFFSIEIFTYFSLFIFFTFDFCWMKKSVHYQDGSKWASFHSNQDLNVLLKSKKYLLQ